MAKSNLLGAAFAYLRQEMHEGTWCSYSHWGEFEVEGPLLYLVGPEEFLDVSRPPKHFIPKKLVDRNGRDIRELRSS